MLRFRYGLILLSLLSPLSMPATTLSLYLGTYTSAASGSRGVYRTELDLATGALTAPAFAATASNPTFLAWHPDGRTLYALTESGTYNGKAGGALGAFRVGAEGSLTPLNVEPVHGGNLTHVAIDPSGRVAAVASYGAGQVASFPVKADGQLGTRSSLHSPSGPLGPNKARQDKPHPHSATFSPDGRFVYVCDLGLDRILHYAVDAATAALTPAGETPTAPGAGPRHSKFSADGKFLYVINELASTMATYGVDRASGKLTPLQSLSTLPSGFVGESICAEVRVSPDGRFVYGSNRGHDSLAVFARDPVKGTLTFVETVPCGGKHPRNFNLTPDGRWLVCANRDTDNVTTFKVDPATGRLTPTGHEIKAAQAVCVLFTEK